MAAAFGASRREQDEFALRSHSLAHQAHEKGYFTDLIPVQLPGVAVPVTKDNGIRVSTIDKLTSLKPAFIKPHGTITAANSSFLVSTISLLVFMYKHKHSDFLTLKRKFGNSLTYDSWWSITP